MVFQSSRRKTDTGGTDEKVEGIKKALKILRESIHG